MHAENYIHSDRCHRKHWHYSIGSTGPDKCGIIVQFYQLYSKILWKEEIDIKPGNHYQKGWRYKNVSNNPVFKPKEEVIEICGAKIECINKCLFCNALVQINQKVTSTKCANCGKRQLIDSVIKSTKCEINGKKKDQMVTYTVPTDILEAFCGEEMHNDNKEIFLLSCRKLQIVTTNYNNIISLKKIK